MSHQINVYTINLLPPAGLLVGHKDLKATEINQK